MASLIFNWKLVEAESRILKQSGVHKKTYTGLLTDYFSFVPFSYKLGLVRTLVDRIFKINNTWVGFHLDINNLTKTLGKNSFPSSVIENVVGKFLNNYFTPDWQWRRIVVVVVLWKLQELSQNIRLEPHETGSSRRYQCSYRRTTVPIKWSTVRTD